MDSFDSLPSRPLKRAEVDGLDASEEFAVCQPLLVNVDAFENDDPDVIAIHIQTDREESILGFYPTQETWKQVVDMEAEAGAGSENPYDELLDWARGVYPTGTVTSVGVEPISGPAELIDAFGGEPITTQTLLRVKQAIVPVEGFFPHVVLAGTDDIIAVAVIANDQDALPAVFTLAYHDSSGWVVVDKELSPITEIEMGPQSESVVESREKAIEWIEAHYIEDEFEVLESDPSPR